MTNRFLPIRPQLHQAINVLEGFYGLGSASWNVQRNVYGAPLNHSAKIHEELLSMMESPEYDTLVVLVRLVWELSVDKKESTVWFLRRFAPESSVLFLLCAFARIPLNKILEADLTEAQFHHLTSAFSWLTYTKLHLCVTRTTESFKRMLDLASQRHGAQSAVCDWVPSAVELRAAKKTGLRMIFPDHPPKAR